MADRVIKLPLTDTAIESWNKILEVIMSKQLDLDVVVEDMIGIYANEHLMQWDSNYENNYG